MDDIKQQLAAIKDIFIQELQHKLNALDDAWGAISQGKADLSTFKDMHLVSHSLVGSGATFGFETLSETARKLEQKLKPHVKYEANISTREMAAIEPLLMDVRAQVHAIQAHKNPTPEPQPEIIDPPTPTPDPNEKPSSLYVCVEDPTLQTELARQLGFYGFDIEFFDTVDAFSDAIGTHKPKAAILELPNTKTCQPMANINPHNVPIIFISPTGSLDCRLNAVRRGSYAFFEKPVDMFKMIDTLDNLLHTRGSKNLAILIIEDELTLAKYYEATLSNAGMDVTVVTDPLKVLDRLSEQQPDLILMDLYMPKCSGLELAKIIRQQEEFISTPIVYLSGENDIKKQMAAIALGADDFLIKPIQPEHLVLAITARALRYQTLRGLMARDSLTGLLNHSNIKAQIRFQIDVAKRNKTTLAFGMVDLDKFKLVNDTYGHPAGDQVIKSLSHILKQRLRTTDIIGRYGGEEFAVLLPNVDAHSAAKLLNQLREAFQSIQYHAGDQTFSSTFSCGIAMFPAYEDAISLNDAADKALYQAKQQGRNQIMIADNKPL